MNDQQARKIAIECIEGKRKPKRYWVFEANLYKHGLFTIYTQRAHKEYTKLEQAIALLKRSPE